VGDGEFSRGEDISTARKKWDQHLMIRKEIDDPGRISGTKGHNSEPQVTKNKGKKELDCGGNGN
jgi:hypothetical protein